MRGFSTACTQRLVLVGLIVVLLLIGVTPARAQTNNYEFNDSHFHLTNNIQEGPSIRDFLGMMGSKAGRVAVFGVPLQQEWSYRVDGDRAPTYYLHSDAPLYYYSFTDAWIAMAYKSLAKEQQDRFDPMITGFNPTDMYAADHIRRVLQTFPGVFTGIGEFTIHKEFVSAKIPGQIASLEDPALDRILDFAAEVGLLVILHNDIDIPIAKDVAKDESVQHLGALGYRSVAVDLYGGKSATGHEEAVKLMQSLGRTTSNKMLQGGLDYLKQPGRKLPTIGFSMGGQESLNANLNDAEVVSATVMIYGPALTRSIEKDSRDCRVPF